MDTWRHTDGSIRVDHMDARPGDYYGPAKASTIEDPYDGWTGRMIDMYDNGETTQVAVWLRTVKLPGPSNFPHLLAQLEVRYDEHMEMWTWRTTDYPRRSLIDGGTAPSLRVGQRRAFKAAHKEAGNR